MRIIYGRVNSYEEKPKIEKRVRDVGKIDFDTAQEIRARFKTGMVTQKVLGMDYKVDSSVISRIINNKTHRANK